LPARPVLPSAWVPPGGRPGLPGDRHADELGLLGPRARPPRRQGSRRRGRALRRDGPHRLQSPPLSSARRLWALFSGAQARVPALHRPDAADGPLHRRGDRGLSSPGGEESLVSAHGLRRRRRPRPPGRPPREPGAGSLRPDRAAAPRSPAPLLADAPAGPGPGPLVPVGRAGDAPRAGGNRLASGGSRKGPPGPPAGTRAAPAPDLGLRGPPPGRAGRPPAPSPPPPPRAGLRAP